MNHVFALADHPYRQAGRQGRCGFNRASRRLSVPEHIGGIAMSENNCICEDNWKNLVTGYERYIGRTYVDNEGLEWKFFGLIHGEDDYYYGLSRPGQMTLVTGVCDLNTAPEYSLLPIQIPHHAFGEEVTQEKPLEVQRLCAVLTRMAQQVRDDTCYAEAYGSLLGRESIDADMLIEVKGRAKYDSRFAWDLCRRLDIFLNELSVNGIFGQEGERDPRGDRRAGDWRMDKVQGVDG